jgi:general secretion pathway protein L
MARDRLAKILMSVLRIHAALADSDLRCRWALIDEGCETLRGEGRPGDLPHRALRVQLVISAPEVLITRAHLPRGAARRGGAVLAFAVEDETLGEPDAKHVSWLGTTADSEVLAVFDKNGLKRWLDALAGVGLEPDEVLCETLLLPLAPDEWSFAWNGIDGFVRTGRLAGAATDCGDAQSPPLGLALMLDAAAELGSAPVTIAVYPSDAEAAPDLEAWQARLGIPLRLAAQAWDWSDAAADENVNLVRPRSRWRVSHAALAQLKPAAWIVGVALALHTLALVTDWALLADERRTVRRQMESRFRTLFPDAVSIVDPALQMRRKLADARHVAGQPDSGDFLPMIDVVAASMTELPKNALRSGSYEGGRLTLELGAVDEGKLRRMVARLQQAGFAVDTAHAVARGGQPTVQVTVRAS